MQCRRCLDTQQIQMLRKSNIHQKHPSNQIVNRILLKVHLQGSIKCITIQYITSTMITLGLIAHYKTFISCTTVSQASRTEHSDSRHRVTPARRTYLEFWTFGLTPPGPALAKKTEEPASEEPFERHGSMCRSQSSKLRCVVSSICDSWYCLHFFELGLPRLDNWTSQLQFDKSKISPYSVWFYFNLPKLMIRYHKPAATRTPTSFLRSISAVHVRLLEFRVHRHFFVCVFFASCFLLIQTSFYWFQIFKYDYWHCTRSILTMSSSNFLVILRPRCIRLFSEFFLSFLSSSSTV